MGEEQTQPVFDPGNIISPDFNGSEELKQNHYIRRSHEQGNYEIIPTYTDQIVVTIKSLATGQIMKVYLDEPTQRVGTDGINYTDYTGHFNEEEFIYTPSEGLETTGLPLIYPYRAYIANNGVTTVTDTENHYYMEKNRNLTDSTNLVFGGGLIDITFQDFPNSETLPDSGNRVFYHFTRFGWEEPGIIINPGSGSGSELHPGTEEGGLH